MTLSDTPSPVRALIYVRVSKNREDDAAKPDRQVQSCMHLAAAKGLDVVPYSGDKIAFTDDDVSAYQGKTKRPAYLELLDRLRAGDIDVVLSWHIDRLLRTTKEMLAFIDLARETGVALQTVQGGDLDLATPVGKMVATILSAVAEAEVEVKAERHLLKNAQTRAAGGSTGGPVPFGWRKVATGRVELVPVEAEQLRNATVAVIEGTRTLSAVAKEWNALGSTTTFGKPWSHTGVKKVLMRPRNAGLIDHGGQVVEGVEADWEAVVSRDQWQACRNILTASTRVAQPRKHVLSNLLTCGKCGSLLTAGINQATRHGERVVYDVYKHPPGQKGCFMSISRAQVEDVVYRHARFLLATQDVTHLAPSSTAIASAVELRLQAAELDHKMTDLETLWADGLFNTANYRKQREALSEAQKGVSEALADLERDNAFVSMVEASVGRISFENAGAVYNKFDALPFEHKRVIVKTLFPLIKVNPGRGDDRVHTFRPDKDEFIIDGSDGDEDVPA